MAKYYNVNTFPANAPTAIISLVNVLTASGWTIQSSSNGTNFGAGDTYATTASLVNNYAWITVREPTGFGGREWCFQRITTNLLWRIKVSPYAGFTGSATATRVPTATDEGIIWGSGTDASPTGFTLFPTDNTYKFHTIAESTPVGPVGNQAYGFWAFANISGSTASSTGRTIICQEPLASGSYPSLVGTRTSTTNGDADPCVYGCLYDVSGYAFWSQYWLTGDTYYGTQQTNDYFVFKYFYNYINASGSLTTGMDVLNNLALSSNGNFRAGLTGSFGILDSSRVDIALPYIIGRQGIGTTTARTQNIGYKGVLNFLKLRGTNRNPGDHIDLASSNAYCYVYDLLIPWPTNISSSF